MSVLRPLDKLPGLNAATILLVGTEDALLQQLADSMLKEDCTSEMKVHLAKSLPLPCNVNRPRIDLIVFVVNLHSKHSLQSVEESLCHLDAAFFLGKVAFLATGAGRDSHCSIHRNTVVKLAHTYRSPLLFCDLEIEDFRAAMAQRLVRLLQICAGHVPGVSALNLLSLLRSSENPSLEDPENPEMVDMQALCQRKQPVWRQSPEEPFHRLGPAEDLGAFQVLGELHAVTAPATSAGSPEPWNPASASQQTEPSGSGASQAVEASDPVREPV